MNYKHFVFIALMTVSSVIIANDRRVSDAIKASSYALKIHEQKVSGEGYNKLINDINAHQVFMFGEDHATAEIADLANQIYQDSAQKRPRLLVTEVGPIAAEKIESLIKNGEFERFMQSGLNLQTIPFFAFKEEVPLLSTACQQTLDYERCVIGVDQEFIASAPIIYEYFDTHLPNNFSREALVSFNRWHYINPFVVGQGDGLAVQNLVDSLKPSSDPLIQKRAEQLALTYKIYKNQMGGDAKWANEARESLMMENFLHQLGDGGVPDLYLKFGAYHTMKGESVTVEKAFGKRVDEWAASKGWNTLNLFVDGYQGKVRDPLFGFEKDKTSFTNWSKSPFAEFIPENGAVLFDLRPLRHLANSDAFSKRQKMLIQNYDYMLIFSQVNPATFLPGSLITRTYAGGIIIFALLVLTGLIVLVVKLIKRWRRTAS